MAGSPPSPTVSVIVPTFNSAEFIEETLRSILAQDHDALEVLVVDDGSTDDTAARAEALGDRRVRVVRRSRPSGGPSAPRNTGVREARGEWVALFDSDDLMKPGKLAQQVRLYRERPELGLVMTDFTRFGEGVEQQGASFLAGYPGFAACPKRAAGDAAWVLEGGDAYRALLFENYIGTSSVMIRRSVFDELGGFDESLKNSDDRELWFRICRARDIGFVDRIGHRYRVRAGSVSSRGIGAFEHRLEVFRRQRELPGQTPEMLRQIDRRMAQYLFNIGHGLHRRGRTRAARVRYRESLGRAFSWQVLAALAKTLLPSALYDPGRGDRTG